MSDDIWPDHIINNKLENDVRMSLTYNGQFNN